MDHIKLGYLWTVAADQVLRAGEHEVEPSPISFRVPVRRQEGAHRLGRSVDGSFGLGVGVARRRACEWGVGPPLKCVQLAAIGGASNHEWAMGDGVVVGEVVADTQALGKRWTHSFACSAAVPEV